MSDDHDQPNNVVYLEDLEPVNYIEPEPRTPKEIVDEYKKLSDKVWWNRHMATRGNPKIKDEVQSGRAAARCIEERWGLEFLDPGDPVEWGITQGKMMALCWVMGCPWEDSGDT